MGKKFIITDCYAWRAEPLLHPHSHRSVPFGEAYEGLLLGELVRGKCRHLVDQKGSPPYGIGSLVVLLFLRLVSVGLIPTTESLYFPLAQHLPLFSTLTKI